MNYTKPALTFDIQLQKLKDRGLLVKDDKKALTTLSNISFYRLRAYTYTFQDNVNPNHPFIIPVSFEQIISLYDFDRKLRLLVLDAIENIEIALRTQIIYHWSLKYGSHWQLNPNLYRNSTLFAKHITSLQTEIDRSSETFIEHYNKKYSNPTEPPCWMSLEVSSFGLLSHIFSNLKKGDEKKNITAHFGLKRIEILENWMHSFSNIRNICAHHGRLWNRRMTNHMEIPYNTSHPFLVNTNILPYKIFIALSAMVYILSIINPQSSFKNNILNLLNNCTLEQEKEMGFPKNWREEPIWN